MKHYYFLSLLLFFLNNTKSSAQVKDDFNDGDFTQNPAWQGDTSSFRIYNQQLQLYSSGVDSSYLSTAVVLPNTIDYEWRFNFELAFSPSSSNYGRIYLLSDQSNLKNVLQGYYIQFGESGSNDAISLYQQNGYVASLIAKGVNGQIANAFQLNIKVNYDSTGAWKIFYEDNGSSVLACSGINSLGFFSGYFGLKCVYTTSNATKMFLDDIYIGKKIIDTIPPVITNFEIVTDSSLLLKFSEAIDSTSAINLTNYLLMNNFSNPVSINFSNGNKDLLLSFNQNFQSGDTIKLIVSKLNDIAGNTILLDTVSVIYKLARSPKQGDLIFTEIMSDPSGANNLPEVEYLEIYNRTNEYINLYNCSVKDPTTQAKLPDQILDPNTYMVLCSSTKMSQLSSLGNIYIVGLSTFPSLNNSGDDITLLDSSNLIIDHVEYTTNYYHNQLKAGGGWSIERIDNNYTCENENNWGASNDSRGGSPGIKNSIDAKFIDTLNFYLEYIIVDDPNAIILHFNKPLNQNDALNITNYYIDGNLGFPINIVYTDSKHQEIKLELVDSMKLNTIYHLEIRKEIQDCSGNLLKKKDRYSFGVPREPEQNDVVINEILFNPLPYENDFVELYNNGEKIISLKGINIANGDLTSGIINDYSQAFKRNRILTPGEYVVLTTDREALSKIYTSLNWVDVIECDLPSYPDDEGMAILSNSNFDILDSLHYYETMHFQLLNTTEGVSLERINPSAKNKINNWHSASTASGFGTPTHQNSQFYEMNTVNRGFSISPEVFSPDNDGYFDLLNINLTFPNPDSYISIYIYDKFGGLVKTITENEILGSENNWIWDGTNENGKVMSVGVYIIYSRVINLDGSFNEEKKLCVLAFKD